MNYGIALAAVKLMGDVARGEKKDVVLKPDGGFFAEDCDKAIIDALDKQIPKNAIVEKRAGDNVYCCPVCGQSARDFLALHCQRCGQAVNWFGTEVKE